MRLSKLFEECLREGYTHVETYIPRFKTIPGFQSLLACVQAELCPLLTHIVSVHKLPHCLFVAHTLSQKRHKKLTGPYPRQRAPGRTLYAGGQSRPVNGVFYKPLAVTVADELSVQFIGGYGCLAVVAFSTKAELAAGSDKVLSLAESQLHPVALRLSYRVLRPLLRKKGQHYLLHGVFIIMSFKIQFHGHILRD